MAASKPSKTPWTNALDMEQVGEGEFYVDYPPDFCYGTRAHGGLMASLVERAVRIHFESSPSRPNLLDVVDLKVYYLRVATIAPTSIKIEDLAVSKRSATVEARVSQDGKLNSVFLVSVGDFSIVQGPSFETNWKLDPPPRPADTAKMARDADPEWISYQVPWHPKSYLRIMSHAKFFFPYRPHPDPTVRDMWIAPVDSDPVFRWTNEHLGYVADLTFSPLENWQGEEGVASDASMIRQAKAQKSDRDAGKPLKEKTAGLSPFTSYSTSMNIDVKKRLPDEGVSWLFTRTSSRQATEGRMDWDVTIHDEGGDLVAIVHVNHQIISLRNNPMPGGTEGETGKPRL